MKGVTIERVLLLCLAITLVIMYLYHIRTTTMLKEEYYNVKKELETLKGKYKLEVKKLLEKKAKPYWVIDALGRNITFTKPPKRIVCLSPSITEIVFAINASSLIVGVDNTSDYPPIIVEWKREGKVVDVGGYWWTLISIEKIAICKPDLIIAEIGAHYKLYGKLKSLGFKVVFVKGGASTSIEDILKDIEIISKALNKPLEGFKLENKILKEVNEVTGKLLSVEARKVKVFIELGYGKSGIWSCGKGTFINELVSLACGENILSDRKGWVQVGFEDVVARNPEVIIVCSFMGKEGINASTYLKIVRSRPGWVNIKAVREHKVFIIVNYTFASSLLRPGPRIVQALKLLISILHPEVKVEGVKEAYVKC